MCKIFSFSFISLSLTCTLLISISFIYIIPPITYDLNNTVINLKMKDEDKRCGMRKKNARPVPSFVLFIL